MKYVMFLNSLFINRRLHADKSLKVVFKHEVNNNSFLLSMVGPDKDHWVCVMMKCHILPSH